MLLLATEDLKLSNLQVDPLWFLIRAQIGKPGGFCLI